LLASRLGRVFVNAPPSDPHPGFLEKLFKLAGDSAIPTTGLSLGGYMALTAGARCFLGVDSLGVHMAGAYGVPLVAIFGPGCDGNWRPSGPWVRVAATGFPCRPCLTGGCLGDGVSRCLKELDYESRVKPLLEELLEAAAAPAEAARAARALSGTVAA
jgi:ADP-heptose:LPS heptosyltransferase